MALQPQNERPFGFRDKLGYLFGDFGNDFTFIFAGSYLTLFYTDVLGVSAGLVGVLFVALVIWAVAKKHITKKPELWCIAAITGGAIGNLIDRVATGKVIDMICVPWFSTFNVADIFITVPAVLLILYILIFDREFLSDKPKKDASHDDPA